MKTQTTVKINKENTISILNYDNGTYEIAHLVNGEYTETILNDVITTNDEWNMVEEVQELASKILINEIEKGKYYSITPEVDATAIIDTFTYNIWIYATLQDNKLVWECSTIHNECEDEDKDKNKVTRNTWNGLMNYIKRFDR